MIKKNVLLSVATITMVCFIFAGCAGGSDNEADEDAKKDEKTEEKASEKEKSEADKSADATESSAEEMTEDLYVEIIAQQMYLGDKFDKKAEDVSDEEAMKLSAEMSEELNNLYQEHGVSQDDFDQFADKIMEEDMESYQDLMERAGERADELMAEDE
ncbi:MAG: hypothetical protein ACQES1_08930 [Bacteroidota bacterium]